jgi:hypothetical protein
VALFAEDAPAIAAPLLSTARLGSAEWSELLPALSPTARGFVRNRRDLDPVVQRALDAFGSIDLVLHAPEGAEPAVEAVAVAAVEEPDTPTAQPGRGRGCFDQRPRQADRRLSPGTALAARRARR